MFRILKFFSATLLAMLCLTACRTTQHLGYDGPQRPAAETATLQGMQIGGQYNWAAAKIERIGGKEITSDPFAKLEIIHALPGKQQVDIVVEIAYQERRASFEFDLMAGHAYEVRIVVDESMIPKHKLVLHSAELYDLTEQKQVMVLTGWGPIKNVDLGPTTIYIQL